MTRRDGHRAGWILAAAATLAAAAVSRAEPERAPSKPAATPTRAPAQSPVSGPEPSLGQNADAPDSAAATTRAGRETDPTSPATGIAVIAPADGDRTEQRIAGGKGGETIARPEAARRVVRLFDFERRLDEPGRAELFDLPRYWDVALDGTPVGGARPGYPRWNKASLDDTGGINGSGALRLETRGGSTGVRLQAGVAPVFPRTQYLVSAKVRTRGLDVARALVGARYLDKANHTIAGTDLTSTLVITTDDEWTTATVLLPGSIDNAAFVQVDLEIVQPEQFASGTLGAHQVWPQDYRGVAWFDDVAVVQLPAVEMETSAPGGVVVAPAKPSVRVLVRDLTGDDLTAELVMQDADGVIVDSQSRKLVGGRTNWEWTPRVERTGWYRAVLELRARGRRVGSSAIDIVWLPPEKGAPRAGVDERRFNLILREAPPAGGSRALRELIRASGSGLVTIPAWRDELKREELPQMSDQLGPLVAELAAEGRQVSLWLPEVPRELADSARLSPLIPMQAFERAEDVWGPWLYPLLDRMGQSVPRWQVGRPGNEDLTTDWRGAVGLGRMLARMAPGAVVAAPWPFEFTPSPGFAASGSGSELTLSVPPELNADALTPLAAAWMKSASTSGTGLTMALSAMPPESGSRLDAAAHLVRQGVALWAAIGDDVATASGRPAAGLALNQPWTWELHPGDPPTALPHPELLAWRTMSERLVGRTVLGRFPSAEGITAWILSPRHGERTGIVVAYRSSPPTDGASGDLEAFLGEGAVRVVDLFGNARDIKPTELGGPGGKVHRVPLTDRPVFIERVDVELTRFVAGFSVEPRSLSTIGTEQQMVLSLTNPWSSRLSGRITVLEPGGLSLGADARDRGWRYAPRSQNFVAAPGETLKLPVGVTFSEVEEAGPRRLVAEVELAAAGREYPPVRVSAGIELTLNGLALDLSYRIVGKDVVLEATVRNDGTASATLSMGVFPPGLPRERASITDLLSGSSAVRRFVLRDAAASLRGKRVGVSVQAVEKPGRLNRSVLIE